MKNTTKKVFKVGNDFNNWDILDGRRKIGSKVKFVSKIFNFIFMVLAYGLLAGIIALFAILWI